MIITSTLSNFLSNLNNHLMSKKTVLKLQQTKLIVQIVNLLLQEGLILGYFISDNDIINILLKYENNKSVIKTIQQISKPGKRIYIKNKWLFKNKIPGIYIVSTKNGFLTHKKALQSNLGGELICKII